MSGSRQRSENSRLVELAEVQLKLGEVLTENASLKAQLHPEVICCPRCSEHGWRVVETRPHKTPGVVVQIWACRKCKLKEETLIKTK